MCVIHTDERHKNIKVDFAANMQRADKKIQEQQQGKIAARVNYKYSKIQKIQ